jgi:hypothetical protein
MKSLICSTLAILLISTSVGASKLSQELASNDVSHFELLVNNLNIILVSQKLVKNEEPVADENGIKELLTKFSVKGRDEDKMQVVFLYSAPVAILTDIQCRKLLSGNTNQIKVDNSNLVNLFSTVSLYGLDVTQVNEILSETTIKIRMIAEENAELSIDC